ncbi:MAG: hypothetical protein GY730_03375 [bacterium]|nr:hypothetical protein [bacterium]
MAKNKDGISVIELIIVLFIVSVISFITFPKYSSHRAKISLQTTSEKAKSIIDLARSYALSMNKEIAVELDIESSYLPKQIKIMDDLQILDYIDIKTGIYVTANPTIKTIAYTPQGLAQFKTAGGGSIVTPKCIITFRNSETTTSDIVIFPNSGSCQLIRYE